MRTMNVRVMNFVLCVTAFASMSPSFASKDMPHKSAAKKMTAVKAATEIYAIDTTSSAINWVGMKLKDEHTGSIGIKEGKLEVAGNEIVGGELIIDMNTITNTDVKDEGYNKKLVDHLKGDDFFAAEKFPTATFKLQKFEELHNFKPGEPNAKIKGMMTIRGKTQAFSAPMFYVPNEGKAEIKGKITIDRTKFDVKYNSKKFFSIAKLGDKLIKDEFTVELNLVAKK